jgi:cation/acetate symporter
VVSFYLIAQMVGAGGLIHLLFGLSYRSAVLIVGGVMLLYVLFGGMIATTWVQIIKAVLLLSGATLLAAWCCRGSAGIRSSCSAPPASATATRSWRRASWWPSPLEAISLGIALMFGTAGLPHILMRFYTVPDAAPRAARSRSRPGSSAGSTW